jgi:flagellar basal-body rod modification protein FlgD
MNATGNAATTNTTSSGAASTISANDFLTLLVTEMKNQDPTANNDPNQYINQLVSVNSLEQLIDINQNLTTALGTGPTTSSPGQKPAAVHSAGLASTPSSVRNASASSVHAAWTDSAVASSPAAANHNVRARVSGNLSIPAAQPAAHRVAEALSGQH